MNGSNNLFIDNKDDEQFEIINPDRIEKNLTILPNTIVEKISRNPSDAAGFYLFLLKKSRDKKRFMPTTKELMKETGNGREKIQSLKKQLIDLGLLKIQISNLKGRHEIWQIISTEIDKNNQFKGYGKPVRLTENPLPLNSVENPPYSTNARARGFLNNKINNNKKNIAKKIFDGFSNDFKNNKEFRQLWKDWLDYRKQIKKPLTEKTIAFQINKLLKWGIEKSICSIKSSIENGWTGLFEPDNSKNKGKVKRSSNAIFDPQNDYQAFVDRQSKKRKETNNM